MDARVLASSFSPAGPVMVAGLLHVGSRGALLAVISFQHCCHLVLVAGAACSEIKCKIEMSEQNKVQQRPQLIAKFAIHAPTADPPVVSCTGSIVWRPGSMLCIGPGFVCGMRRPTRDRPL